MKHALAALIALSTAAPLAAQEDGPDGASAGGSKGAPAGAPETLPLRWRRSFELPARACDVAVHEDLVLVGTGSPEGELLVYPLGPDDGELLEGSFAATVAGEFDPAGALVLRIAADVDGDGARDVFAFEHVPDLGAESETKERYALLSGADGARLASFAAPEGARAGALDAAFVDADEPYVAIGWPMLGVPGRVTIHDPQSGALESSLIARDVAPAWDCALFGRALAALGGGDAELVVGIPSATVDERNGCGGVVALARGADGFDVAWRRAGESAGASYGLGVVAVADVDGDGARDVAVSSRSGVDVLSGATGDVLARIGRGTEGRWFGGLVAADPSGRFLAVSATRRAPAGDGGELVVVHELLAEGFVERALVQNELGIRRLAVGARDGAPLVATCAAARSKGGEETVELRVYAGGD